MSRLEDLIQELCPNGVEYKTLEEIAIYRRGSFPQPYGQSQWYDGEGAMPFVQVADVNDDFTLVNDTKQKISKLAQSKSIFVPSGTVIVTLQGTIGRVAITQYNSYVDRTLAIFENYKIKINKKFFAYVLKQKFDIEKQHARGSTLKTITKEEFSKFTIPVPPMKVQCEIVKILDNFTELTAELTEKLTAELTARKKQYEYYQRQLLQQTNIAKHMSLGECASISVGSKPINLLEEKTDVEYINAGTTNSGYTNLSNCEGDTVTTPSRGQGGIGFVGYQKKPFWLGPLCYSIKSILPNELITKFLFYYLQSNNNLILALKKEGSVPAINRVDLVKVLIPVPPLEEQQRIVSILEMFDAWCNDISIGLPAEIEARKKQYEYYRDKLLTFKEKVA